MRATLGKAAEQGNANAIQLLEPPEFPDDLQYLWGWHVSLRMGMGEMMTWSDLAAWAIHMQTSPEPRECEALFYLGAIYRNPPKE